LLSNAVVALMKEHSIAQIPSGSTRHGTLTLSSSCILFQEDLLCTNKSLFCRTTPRTCRRLTATQLDLSRVYSVTLHLRHKRTKRHVRLSVRLCLRRSLTCDKLQYLFIIFGFYIMLKLRRFCYHQKTLSNWQLTKTSRLTEIGTLRVYGGKWKKNWCWAWRTRTRHNKFCLDTTRHVLSRKLQLELMSIKYTLWIIINKYHLYNIPHAYTGII